MRVLAGILGTGRRYDFLLVLLAFYVVSYGLHFNGLEHDFPTMLDKHYALTQSIVEYGALDLNRQWAACEENLSSQPCRDSQFAVGADGNKYAFFSPGLSFLGVPFYYAAHLAGFGRDVELASLIFLNTILGLLIVLVIYRISLHCGNSARDSKVISLIFGTGTIIYTYSQTFASDIIGSLLILTSFYMYLLYVKDGRPLNLLFLGLLSGYLYTLKFNLLIPVAFLMPLILMDIKGRDKGRAVAVIALAAGFIATFSIGALYYNALFGSPFRTGYNSALLKGPTTFGQVRDYVATGFGNNPLKGVPGVFFAILISSPFLAFPLYYMARGAASRDRIQISLLLSVAASIILYGFYLTPLGSWCFGPRYALSVIPLLSYPLAMRYGDARKSRLFWVLFALSVAVTLASQNFATWNGFWSPYENLISDGE